VEPVLAFNWWRCVMCEAARARGVSPFELSFTAALAVLDAACVARGDAEAVEKWVVARVGANRLPRRKGGPRDEPRRVKAWHRTTACCKSLVRSTESTREQGSVTCNRYKRHRERVPAAGKGRNVSAVRS